MQKNVYYIFITLLSLQCKNNHIFKVYMVLYNRSFPASCVSYYNAAHLSSISPILSTYPTLPVPPATTGYLFISCSYLCHAYFSMLLALPLILLSTSCPKLFPSCVSLHAHGSSPHASLHLMAMALPLIPLSTSWPWLLPSCLSPPHAHGSYPHASLHLIAMALTLMPLST